MAVLSSAPEAASDRWAFKDPTLVLTIKLTLRLPKIVAYADPLSLFRTPPKKSRRSASYKKRQLFAGLMKTPVVLI